MIEQVLLGLFALALGSLCLKYAFRIRRVDSPLRAARRAGRDGPREQLLKWLPLTCGALFIVTGVKALAWVLLAVIRQHFTDLP